MAGNGRVGKMDFAILSSGGEHRGRAPQPQCCLHQPSRESLVSLGDVTTRGLGLESPSGREHEVSFIQKEKESGAEKSLNVIRQISRKIMQFCAGT